MKNKIKIIIIGVMISLIVLVVAQSLLPKKDSLWKVPNDFEPYKNMNQNDFDNFIEDNYGNDITTTDIAWNPNVSMYDFSLYNNTKESSNFLRRIMFKVQENATTLEIQEEAEMWINLWMAKQYKKTLEKDSVGGLDFS